MAIPQHVSGSGLNARLRDGGKPLLLYVWAPWCPPCRTMTPAVSELAAMIGERADVFKLNAADDSQALVGLNIAAVPMLVLFDADGKERTRRIGNLDLEQMTEILNLL